MKKSLWVLLLLLGCFCFIVALNSVSADSWYDDYSSSHPDNNSVICPCTDCSNYSCICVNPCIDNYDVDFYYNSTSQTGWNHVNYTNQTNSTCYFFQVEYGHNYSWYANVTSSDGSHFNQTEILYFTVDSYENCTIIESTSCDDIETVIMEYLDNNSMYIITLVLFGIFFIIGYLSERRGAGAFLFISGFLLLSLGILLLSEGSMIGILVVVSSIFVCMMGINHWFILPNKRQNNQK